MWLSLPSCGVRVSTRESNATVVAKANNDKWEGFQRKERAMQIWNLRHIETSASKCNG